MTVTVVHYVYRKAMAAYDREYPHLRMVRRDQIYIPDEQSLQVHRERYVYGARLFRGKEIRFF